jgi:hypothetical protein
MSDEPEAQADVLVARIFGLLAEARTLLRRLEYPRPGASASAEAERALYFVFLGALDAVVPARRGDIRDDPAHHVPLDGGGVRTCDAAQPGRRGRRARRLLTCAVASGSWGCLGPSASECDRLCRDDAGPRARRSPPEAAHVGFAQKPGKLL